MLGSTNLIKNPSVKFLRLEQLYETLFNTTFENPHNAIADARATARCFFEMMKRGEITEEIIERQQRQISEKEALPKGSGCFIPILVIVSLIILIIYL
jgi:DNA polymerase-3 subunit epsilon